jgi:hypothetical protein
MTFDKFKKDFITFLENSTVNLGRKTAKTRNEFIKTAIAKFDAFASSRIKPREVFVVDEKKKEEKVSNPMDDRVVRIKPKDRNKALDVGKGVHAMSGSESMRADEQLDRSPFGAKTAKKVGEQKDE